MQAKELETWILCLKWKYEAIKLPVFTSALQIRAMTAHTIIYNKVPKVDKAFWTQKWYLGVIWFYLAYSVFWEIQKDLESVMFWGFVLIWSPQKLKGRGVSHEI